jgi:hypothetical protein
MHEGQRVSSLSQQKNVTAFTNPFFLKIASPESPHSLSGTHYTGLIAYKRKNSFVVVFFYMVSVNLCALQ